MTGPAIKRPATILRMPPAHQREARARIVVWQTINRVRRMPPGPRRHPGGFLSPQPKEPAA